MTATRVRACEGMVWKPHWFAMSASHQAYRHVRIKGHGCMPHTLGKWETLSGSFRGLSQGAATAPRSMATRHDHRHAGKPLPPVRGLSMDRLRSRHSR
jgi:hypothetical protein